jgi:hypothetical protein
VDLCPFQESRHFGGRDELQDGAENPGIWDHSLLVVKRDPSLPVAIQLNAFSGPAMEVKDVTVDGNCVPRNNRSKFFSRGDDDSVVFGRNGDAIVPFPPGAAHKIFMVRKSKVISTKTNFPVPYFNDPVPANAVESLSSTASSPEADSIS